MIHKSFENCCQSNNLLINLIGNILHIQIQFNNNKKTYGLCITVNLIHSTEDTVSIMMSNKQPSPFSRRLKSMIIMKHVNFGLFLFSTLCMLLPTSIIAVLPGTWPPVNAPPPANAAYTKLVDISKIRNAPLTKTNATCAATDTYCYWTCSLCTRNATDVITCPNKLDWGLTLDDGPTSFTTAVLDYLDTQNVKVTFFVIGSNVYQNPDILLRAFKAGHQIGVHTWSHTALTSQSNEVVIAELKYTADAIRAATNFTPKYMRPPFGDYDDRIRDISTQLEYWSHLPST
ncbi:Carbohydrate Esterase Family 4 protein [Gigaspora rosea]|uniref:Carbohydrate Esterase Family 4 protein n=1 Tax=Gigaspora rosea TaxID=44941 RepID=A0A397WC18_9GLOM|nr:Carbohydrate Esterase Family 4 protein [Gigaspora rosea]